MSTVAHDGVLPAQHEPHIKVLRAVASLELTKGLIVLAGAFGILFLVHRDPGDVADWCLTFLHISPDHHFAQIFLDWADTLTEKKLWVVAATATLYSCLRFAEAYGLWKARTWAEWIAMISGTIYMPFEIFKLVTRPSMFHVGLLVVNLAIVLYMAYILVETRARRSQLREAKIF